jgi:hypothetical protein
MILNKMHSVAACHCELPLSGGAILFITQRVLPSVSSQYSVALG